MRDGWIKLWRQMLDSAVMDDPHLCHLWVFLLLEANWSERQLLNGQTLDPGQLVVSQPKLAQRFGCGKSSIGRRLAKLEKLGNIGQAGGHGGTVITICNWQTYQQDDGEGGQASGPKADRKRTEGGPKADTEEEGKKGRREELNPLSPTATAEKETALLKRESKFIESWNKLEGALPNTRPTLSKKRRSSFRARLAENGWAGDCAKAFKHFPLAQFHGRNGWQPTVDFMLRPDVALNITEGKYDKPLEGDEPTPEKIDILAILEDRDDDER